jgi:actin-like ATPase involved in cell morphogenesis
VGYSLGVDLGVTFVAAAIASPTRVEMFTLGDRSVVTPAAVYLREDGTLVTGEAAAVRAVSSPDRVSREFKRRLGNPAPVMLAGKPFTVTALLGALLRDAVQKVVETQGESPERLVLTHPANWGPFRRALFEEVPQHAGLDNPPTVTEPEAAAAHYAASKLFSDGQTVAVYDLGGGTFDATVLRKQPGGMEILGAPEGIERLGGVDFDEGILSYIDYAADGALSALDLRDPQTSIAMARLRQDCVLAKETLSVDTETVIPVFLPGRHFDVRITRAEFEDMVRAQIEPTIEVLSRTLQSAGVEPGELSAVLLVGGSSRIPLVARMVSAALGRPTVVDIHPKYAVALGAAIIADAAAATSMPRLGARVAPSAKEFAGVVPAQRITRGGEAVILGGRAQQTSANMAPDSTVDPSQPAPPATGRGADRQLAPPPTTTTDTSRGWFRRNINRFHRGEDKSGPAAVSPIIPPGPPYPDAVTGFGPEEHRPVVTRYTDISAPRRLAPGRRGVITVRLTCAPLTASAEIQAVPVLLTQMVEIYLQASGKDFEVEGEPIRQLRVESDRDSESVVFYLTALRAGDAIACLIFVKLARQ